MCFNDYSWRLIKNGTNDATGFKVYLGTTITMIFILEFVIKIIARGFIFGKNCYIEDSWNKLDFIVVVTGFILLIYF